MPANIDQPGQQRRRRIAGERGRRPATGSPATGSPATGSPATGSPATSPEPAPRPAAPARSQESRSTRQPASRGARPGSGRYWWWLAPLTLLTVVTVVLATVLGLRAQDAATLDPARDAAAAAARDAAETVLTFDYRTLDEDSAEAETYLTDDYADKYRAGIESLVSDAAEQTQGSVQAEVRAVAVVPCGDGCSDTRVDVLVFVDQVSRTSASKQPRTALNRVVFSMEKQADRWLVDDVVPL